MTTNIVERLVQIENLCKKSPISNDDPFLKEVKNKCTCLIDICRKSTDNDSLKNLLNQYAQIVLDYTYNDEGKLVDEDFPKESSKERIHDIFVWIDTIEELVKTCLPQTTTVIDCLGHEIVEVIHWRKGALLYMLCSTIKGDDKRQDQINDEFLVNIQNGVKHLQNMLTVQRNGSEWEGDQQAVDLANMGIFSDTHLLSMMYAGEMCYWYCQLQGETTLDFNAKVIGQDLLSKYIKIVKSPSMIGWTLDKAEEFLKFLSECS